MTHEPYYYLGEKIVVSEVKPPIPVRDYDWSARLDNYEPGLGRNGCIGWGRNDIEAVADLRNQLDDYED